MTFVPHGEQERNKKPGITGSRNCYEELQSSWRINRAKLLVPASFFSSFSHTNGYFYNLNEKHEVATNRTRLNIGVRQARSLHFPPIVPKWLLINKREWKRNSFFPGITCSHYRNIEIREINQGVRWQLFQPSNKFPRPLVQIRRILETGSNIVYGENLD